MHRWSFHRWYSTTSREFREQPHIFCPAHRVIGTWAEENPLLRGLARLHASVDQLACRGQAGGRRLVPPPLPFSGISVSR